MLASILLRFYGAILGQFYHGFILTQYFISFTVHTLYIHVFSVALFKHIFVFIEDVERDGQIIAKSQT